MPKPDYSKDLFKQVQELILKCDNLSHKVNTIEKTTEKKFKKELKEQKKFFNDKIEELEKENKHLIDKNMKLENEVDRLKKQINNDSNNSSKPPSTDNKKNIPNNRQSSAKKSGGQKGHKGYHLSKKYIERKIENKEFNHKIMNKGKGEYISKYIIDLDINVIAKEYRFFKDDRGKYKIPKEYKTDVQYGSNIKTICSILNVEGIIAMDRLTNFVSSISGGKINISKGTVVNFLNELNRKSEYLIENIKQKVLNSELMYTDGTTSRVDRRNICVRNYSTKEYTLLKATKGKGKKYIEESNILNRYTGNLVHDHETVMYNYGKRHGECNVHVIRYLKGCYENTGNRWCIKMRSLLCCLNEYRKELIVKGKKQIDKEAIQRYEKRYNEIIEEGYEENKKIKKKFLRQDEQRLLNRLKKYKENHLLFLHDFNMPFDNNLSERDLRHVKIKQKVSGHFNSIEGIQNYLNIKSIIMTMKKNGQNFYDSIYKTYENIPVSIN